MKEPYSKFLLKNRLYIFLMAFSAALFILASCGEGETFNLSEDKLSQNATINAANDVVDDYIKACYSEFLPEGWSLEDKEERCKDFGTPPSSSSNEEPPPPPSDLDCYGMPSGNFNQGQNISRPIVTCNEEPVEDVWFTIGRSENIDWDNLEGSSGGVLYSNIRANARCPQDGEVVQAECDGEFWVFATTQPSSSSEGASGTILNCGQLEGTRPAGEPLNLPEVWCGIDCDEDGECAGGWSEVSENATFSPAYLDNPPATNYAVPVTVTVRCGGSNKTAPCGSVQFVGSGGTSSPASSSSATPPPPPPSSSSSTPPAVSSSSSRPAVSSSSSTPPPPSSSSSSTPVAVTLTCGAVPSTGTAGTVIPNGSRPQLTCSNGQTASAINWNYSTGGAYSTTNWNWNPPDAGTYTVRATATCGTGNTGLQAVCSGTINVSAAQGGGGAVIAVTADLVTIPAGTHTITCTGGGELCCSDNRNSTPGETITLDGEEVVLPGMNTWCGGLSGKCSRSGASPQMIIVTPSEIQCQGKN